MRRGEGAKGARGRARMVWRRGGGTHSGQAKCLYLNLLVPMNSDEVVAPTIAKKGEAPTVMRQRIRVAWVCD